MGRLIRAVLLRCFLSITLTVSAVGFLVWLSPGREFADPAAHGIGAVSVSGVSVGAVPFVWEYAVRLAGGDAGYSAAFQAPVAELIRERFAVTAATLGRAMVALAAVAGVMAMLALRYSSFRVVCRLLSGVLYSIPVGIFAIPLAALFWPLEIAVVLGALPKAFTLLDAIFERHSQAPHLLWMRAMGVRWRSAFWYGILGAARTELLEIAALLVPVLLGTLIVVEVLSGQPGLGTLAWRAVQARDLPLLGGITILFAAGTSLAAAVTRQEDV